MNILQELHLQSIINDFRTHVSEKYAKGVREHGGNLWEKPGMIAMLKQEHIDAYVYLCTIEQQLKDLPPEESKKLLLAPPVDN